MGAAPAMPSRRTGPAHRPARYCPARGCRSAAATGQAAWWAGTASSEFVSWTHLQGFYGGDIPAGILRKYRVDVLAGGTQIIGCLVKVMHDRPGPDRHGNGDHDQQTYRAGFAQAQPRHHGVFDAPEQANACSAQGNDAG